MHSTSQAGGDAMIGFRSTTGDCSTQPDKLERRTTLLAQGKHSAAKAVRRAAVSSQTVAAWATPTCSAKLLLDRPVSQKSSNRSSVSLIKRKFICSRSRCSYVFTIQHAGGLCHVQVSLFSVYGATRSKPAGLCRHFTISSQHAPRDSPPLDDASGRFF